MLHADIRISGKVQGVFYREFAMEEAEQREIVGWVKNEKNGTVSICAQGYEARLKDFIKKLEEGTPLSEVTFVQVAWKKNPTETFDDFAIVTESNDEQPKS